MNSKKSLFFILLTSILSTSCVIERPVQTIENLDELSNENPEVLAGNERFNPDEFWKRRWKPTAPNQQGPIITTLTPNTDRSYLSNAYKGNWQRVWDAGLVQHSSLKWINMTQLNETTYSCLTLWVLWEGDLYNSTAIEVKYSPATIKILANKPNNYRIVIESISPWSGTVPEKAYYEGVPYD